MTAIVEDPALLGLAAALDPDRMTPLIVRAAGLSAGEAAGLTCSAEVIKHDVGKRCTIRYQLRPRSGGSDPSAPPVIGKLYRSKRRAARVHGAIEALHGQTVAGAGPLRLPAALALIPDLRLVLQEFAPGEDLRHALAAGAADVPIALAARWIAALHATPAPPGLKATSLAHELDKLGRWHTRVAATLEPQEERRFSRAWDSLSRMASELSDPTRTLIHKDLYYAHVLWDGENVWVLDYDQLSTGDPAFDVGHFTAHLENLAYRTAGRADAYEEPARLFVETYERQASIPVAARLPFYRAYTFIKLAATEVSRNRPAWQERTRLLADLACREAEASARA